MASKSIVHTHFENIPENPTGSYKATCKLCRCHISAMGKTTSNLITHLKRNHAGQLKQVSSSTQHKQTMPTSFIQPLGTVKYTATDPKQARITAALVEFVAETLQPLSVVEAPTFIRLFDAVDPRYQLPSRKHLSTNLITDTATHLQENMRKAMSKVRSVSVTIVLWTNRHMRTYLGITGHFVLDYKLVSAMLSCQRLKGRHAAEDIHSSYTDTLQLFNINNKVSYIITDNATHTTQAFSLPGFDAGPAPVNDSDTPHSDTITAAAEFGEDVFEFLPQHQPCFAHTLQLVVEDGIKETGSLRKVIAKASAIVSQTRKYTQLSGFLEKDNKLHAAIVSRWSSQVKMIRSVLNIPKDKLDQCDTLKLSNQERIHLTDLVQILSPLEEATDYAQTQNKVSVSYILPCIRGLKSELCEMDSRFHNKILSLLTASATKRLAQYEDTESLVLATILDPRFKLQWCASDSEVYSAKRSLLQHHCSLISDTPETVQIEHTLSPPRKKSRLFGFMGKTPATPRANTGTVDGEIQDYLSTPCVPENSDALEYWNMHHESHPCLSKLAVQYLGIPSSSSSAAVERLFTVGGELFYPDGCRLGDRAFGQLMCIKNNTHFA
ncbi:zinc finger BED domain-containing protein 4-like [Gigantopelta aegis]|uniref:zinc finger BED domain-containing protein 4-like n=1 Tax=Gigantopelta aegis TaxID=1735272 RepID=UPI001B889277|nr:zinc finger BED domain-containing protein 4-like [Gigantopelta aegis]